MLRVSRCFRSLISVILLFILVPEVYSQTIDDIFISEESFDFNLLSGDSVSASFTIENNYSEPLNLSLSSVIKRNPLESDFYIADDYVYSVRGGFNNYFPGSYETLIIRFSLSENNTVDTLYYEERSNNDEIIGAIANYDNKVYFWSRKDRDQIKVLNIETQEIVNRILLPQDYVISSLSHSGNNIYAVARNFEINNSYFLIEIDEDTGEITKTIETGNSVVHNSSISVNSKTGVLYKTGVYENDGAIEAYDLINDEWDRNFFSSDNHVFFHITYLQSENAIIAYGYDDNEYLTRSFFFIDAESGEIVKEQLIESYRDFDATLWGLATNETGLPGFFNWESENSVIIDPSENVTFEFEANAIDLYKGEYSAEISVFFDGEYESVASIPLNLSISGSSEIVVEPDPLVYESIFIGDSSRQQILISNDGVDGLVISGITFSNPVFQLANDTAYPIILGPGEKKSIDVVFKPTSAGLLQATMDFTTNDETDPVYSHSLIGTGVLAPEIEINPERFSFTVNSFEQREESFNVSNTGGSTLDYKVSGSGDPARLTIDNNSESIYFIGSMWFNAPDPPFAIFEYDLADNKIIDTLSIDYNFIDGTRNIARNESNLYFKDLRENRVLVYDIETENIVTSFVPGGNTDLWTTIEYHDGEHLIASKFNYGENVILYSIDDSNGKVVDSLIVGNFPRDFGEQFTLNVADSLLYYTVSRTIYQVDLKNGSDTTHVPLIELFDYDKFKLGYSASRNSLIIYTDKNNRSGFYLEEYSFETSELQPVLFNENFRGPNLYDIATLNVALPSYIEINSPVIDSLDATESTDFIFSINTDHLIEGFYKSEIIFSTNSPQNRVKRVPIDLEVIGIPLISTSADSMDYGNLIIGEKSTQFVTFKNTGTKSLNISNISIADSQFSIPDSVSRIYTLDPIDSIRIPINFQPNQSGTIESELIITNDSQNHPSATIFLKGSSLTPANIEISSESLSFLPDTNQAIESSISITNTGEQNLSYQISIEKTLQPETEILDNPTYFVAVTKGIESGEYMDMILEYSTKSTTAIDTIFVQSGSGNLNGLAYFDDKLFFINRLKSLDLQVIDLNTKQLLNPIPIDDNFNGGFYSLSHNGEYLIGSIIGESGYPTLLAIDDEFGGILDTLVVDYTRERIYETTVNAKENILYRADFDSGKIYIQSLDSLNSQREVLLPKSGFQSFQEISYSSSSHSILVSGRFQDGYDQKLLEFDATDGSFLGEIKNDLGYISRMATYENSGFNYLQTNREFQKNLVQNDTASFDFELNTKGVIEGNYGFDITIRSNDFDEPLIKIPIDLVVKGIPEISVNQRRLNFGTIFTGQEITKSIYVKNNGTGVLDISSLTLTDDNFSIIDYTGDRISIEPAQIKKFELSFTPESENEVDAELLIQSNSLLNSAYSIQLVGTALNAPVLEIDNLNVLFELQSGDLINNSLVLTNTGGSDLFYDLEIDYDSTEYDKADFFIPIQTRDVNTGEYSSNILSLSWNNGNVIDTIYSTPSPFDNIQSLAFFDGRLFFENPNEPNLITIIDAQTGEELRELRLKVYSDFKIQSLSMLEEGILVSALDSETELNHHFLHSWVNGAVLDTLAISETNYFSLSRHPSSGKYYAVNRGVIEEQPIHSSGEINTLNISESYYFTQVSYSPKDQSLVTYGFNKRNPSNAQFFKIDINSLNVVDSLWLGTSIKNSIIYGPFGLTAKVTDFPFIELISDVESVIPKSESDIVEYRVDGTNLFTNSYYAEITVNSNDPVNSVSTIGIDVHVNGLPGISLPTETVEFKETIVNSTSYERIKIHNSGSDELIISNFEFENNLFQLADTLQKYSIYPRHSMILDVLFNPTDSIGLYSDQLNFKSNINGSSTHGISLEALVLNGSMLSFEKR